MPVLEADGVKAVTDQQKADLLANYFAVQCTSTDTAITGSPGAPYPSTSGRSMSDFHPVSEGSILKQLRKLPAIKSTADQIITN